MWEQIDGIQTQQTLASCLVCCEDLPAAAMCLLFQCAHECCQECIAKWIKQEESSGRHTPPVCPFCRVELTDHEILSILGRPFQPRSPATSDEAELDALALQWLQEHTRQCPGCGLHIQKEAGGCDKMECLCGCRFCYECGSLDAQCSCTNGNHSYWDNVLRRPATREPALLQARPIWRLASWTCEDTLLERNARIDKSACKRNEHLEEPNKQQS